MGSTNLTKVSNLKSGSARAILFTVLLAIVALVPLSASAQSSTYSLLLSLSNDRSSPTLLDGAAVSGNIYVFTEPRAGVSRVLFYLDDPERTNAPHLIEKSWPYDFNGGGSSWRIALPFDTSTIANGSHTITAAVERTDGLTDVLHGVFTVDNLKLALSAQTLSFAIPEGGSAESQSFDVATSDGASADFTATDDAAWLSVAPGEGTTPSALTATADPSGLAAGTYQAAIMVTAPGYPPATVQVSLSVTSEPTPPPPPPPTEYGLLLSLSSDRSNPVPLDGQTLEKSIYVFTEPTTNVSSVTFYVDDPLQSGTPYLVEKSAPHDLAGTAADKSAVPFDTGILNDGSHTITAVFALSDGSSTIAHATFMVENDRLFADPASVDITLDHGASPVSRSVAVAANGGQAVSYAATTEAPWLTIGSPTGVTPGEFEVIADPAGLAPGTYTTNVVVTADDHYPALIPVTLTVNAQLLVSATADRFGPRALHDREVWGDVYVFAAPESGLKRAVFYLDDPAMTGTPFQSESSAPFDFAGTAPRNNAFPFDTTTLADGWHTITADMTLSTNKKQVVHATFNVINGAPGFTFDPGSLGYQMEGAESITRSASVGTTDGSSAAFTVVAQDVPWLTVTPASSTSPASLDITVDSSQLEIGIHRVTVEVAADGYRSGRLPLEVRVGCPPLACSEVLARLPYELDFSEDKGKILDRNGFGTGFSWIDWPSQGTGYIPGNLEVDPVAGTLNVTTTRGLAMTTSNSQDNALAVGVDGPSQITVVTASLLDIPAGTGQFQQAGIWFGNGEDDYAKVGVVSTPDGLKLEHILEVAGQKKLVRITPALFIAGAKITFSIYADPTEQTLSAYYQINDGGTSSLGVFEVPAEFFSFDAARIDPRIKTDSFAGIFASQRNGQDPLIYKFDYFGVAKGLSAAPQPSQGISFDRTSFSVTSPTSMAWGPDGRLYVSELFGRIHALTLGPDKQPIADQSSKPVDTRLMLGLAIDPNSTPDNVIVWVSHSEAVLANASPNTSVVSRLSGPGLTIREDVITGLPRSLANHSVNALRFGPDGRLYIAQSGNTGAGGRDDEASGEFGDRGEQPLSGALLVADVEAPGFDGSCANTVDIYGPAPCDVVPYSTGLRNIYDFTFHSNGSIYGTDNGLGVGGVIPPSATPPCTDFGTVDPKTQPDILLRLEEGKYYGHPNPTRGECVFKDGTFQGAPALPNYVPPLFDLGDHRSANGIIEYTGDAFCGDLKGDLLIANYSVGDDLTRVQLADDGLSVEAVGSVVGGFDDPLPLVQGPDGEIYVGEFGDNLVTVLLPQDTGCWTPKSSLPAALLDAGGTAVGDKLYVVGGKTNSGYQSTTYVYDPSSDSWSTADNLPGPAVENPAAVAHGGKLYVFGGSTSPFSDAVANAAVLDPATNAWTPLASMPTARGGATAKAIDGKIYVVGGINTVGGSLASVDVFDPATGLWSTAAPMGTRRDNPGSAAIDGKLYVFGGRTRNDDGSTVDGTLSSGEVYDPTTDSWTSIAPMPTGRRTMVVGTLNGRAQVIGGEANLDGLAFAENEEYDPVTDSWRSLKYIPIARHGAAAGTINGFIYVVGGGPTAGSSFTDANEAFSFAELP